MCTIPYVGIFYVTDIPTSDGYSLWSYLIQLQKKVYIHIMTHHREEIPSLAWNLGVIKTQKDQGRHFKNT